MANQKILTYNAPVVKVQQDYYAPVAILPVTQQPIGTVYAFLSRVNSWDNDSNPPTPEQTQQYLKAVYKNIFVVKQINPNQISPVIPRIDWESGTVYDYYRDDIDMFQKDQNNLLTLNFYVRNSYDQVFKCLWNNNGEVSTVMPFFQPGTYSSNNIFKGDDNYKWKYIYTIDTGNKRTFMDSQWMPAPVGQNIPGPVLDNNLNPIGIWSGDIEVINVIDGGSGYSNSVTISVNITGDGTGATAQVKDVNNDGAITDIIITNTGSNYTYANVSITSSSGDGANVIVPISPVGGHGFDPLTELGCNHVMFTCEFNGSEGGVIPTDIDYRQIGLLVYPLAKSSWPNAANGSIYNATTQLTVAPGFGQFTNDEVLYQGASLDQASFKGTVVSFNVATNVVSLINTVGNVTLNASIFGSSSSTVRTALSAKLSDILLPSGYISYIENRSGVQRSADGIEQFKAVLGY
jgi:hypothetical protein